MSHILGYLSNDDSLTGRAFEEVAREWSPGATNGVGLGWMQESRTLERKEPRGDGELDVFGAISALRSRAVVCRVRGEGEEPTRSETMHPFRFKSWMGVARTVQPSLEGVREAIEDELPDFIRTNTRGEGLDEVLFHWHLKYLFAQDAFHTARQKPGAAARALGASVVALEERLEGRFGRFQAVLMTERVLVAVSVGAPMSVRTWRGIEEPPEEPGAPGSRGRPRERPYFRGALCVGGEVDGEGWERLPERSVAWVDADWGVRFEEL
jgi:hypothetical protein